MPTDPRIDAYIAARTEFARPILAWLRERVHAACPDVEESIKWSMPAFGYKGRPLANMAAFKGHVSFGFWSRGELATGKEGEAMGQFGRIERMEDLPPEGELETMIRQQMALIDGGSAQRQAKKPPQPEAEVPEALAQALAADAEATANFNAFPPSARRDYCEWIGEAKRAETRASRVQQAVTWLREGKRRNWKYENC